MDEAEQWTNLIRSINKAARILGLEITETEMPQEWYAARAVHKYLWDQVYLRRKTRR